MITLRDYAWLTLAVFTVYAFERHMRHHPVA